MRQLATRAPQSPRRAAPMQRAAPKLARRLAAVSTAAAGRRRSTSSSAGAWDIAAHTPVRGAHLFGRPLGPPPTWAATRSRSAPRRMLPRRRGHTAAGSFAFCDPLRPPARRAQLLLEARQLLEDLAPEIGRAHV